MLRTAAENDAERNSKVCSRHAVRCSSEQKNGFTVQPEAAEQPSAYRMPDHTTVAVGDTERSAWP